VTLIERNALIEKHLPEVRAIALNLKRRLPPSIEVDDLVQQGSLGLMHAADRFDPAVGIDLITYARRRVIGAMLDSIRRRHWADANAAPLETADQVPAEETTEATVVRKQERREITRAVVRLPDRELHIVQRRYRDGEHLQNIAPSLALSPSRIGQLHQQALAKLRRDLWRLRAVA
jgi:RNA polymerase sigma factor (sigma-70 family)